MGKLLIANWKMHPESESMAVKLAKASDAAGVVLCPPAPLLHAVLKTVKKAMVGAQDISPEVSGPFTGEISAQTLKQMGCRHVIIGHSERRVHFGETDDQIARKVVTALEQGLTPILCVGETRQQREAHQTNEVLDRQLRSALSLIPADIKDQQQAVYIAYEPVWAISTNQVGQPLVESPADTQSVIHYMQGIIRGVPIRPVFLYGGSVNPENVSDFLACPEIEGTLVGAASLDSSKFKKMIAIAAAS